MLYQDVKPNLTIEECDQIALDGGRFDSFGYGYECPVSNEQMNPEYGVRVINTKGMGNHGSFVLFGRTDRAKSLLRQGKVNLLVSQGISRLIAEQCSISHRGMELSVAKAAESLFLSDEFLFERQAIRLARSHKELSSLLGPIYKEHELSFPRWQSAIGIALKCP